jgi:hypothetical protein
MPLHICNLGPRIFTIPFSNLLLVLKPTTFGGRIFQASSASF